ARNPHSAAPLRQAPKRPAGDPASPASYADGPAPQPIAATHPRNRSAAAIPPAPSRSKRAGQAAHPGPSRLDSTRELQGPDAFDQPPAAAARCDATAPPPHPFRPVTAPTGTWQSRPDP